MTENTENTTPSSTWKKDLSAGIVVFLVALPLCLGISHASGAPIFSGIIAGVVGGLIVSLFSRSHLAVTGPAAALALLTVAGIRDLGGFEFFCAATVFSGIVQIVFGWIGLGHVAAVFPRSVIKGLLAAVGIIIILKQVPHALGYDEDFEGDFGFWERAGENTFTEILKALHSATIGPVLICLFAFGVMYFWGKFPGKMKILRVAPAPLVAVLGAIGLNQIFIFFLPGLAVTDPKHFVDLPIFANFSAFLGEFRSPPITAFLSTKVLLTGFVIALVSSVESLFTVEALDRLDPEHRVTPVNRELVAQGIGNMTSGLLGGLPVMAVIVRSSANVYAGAASRRSTAIQGVLLLAAAAFFPSFMNKIPLSALAAILFWVGYSLASRKVFSEMYDKGFDQFFPFIATVVAVVFTSILTGVLIGLAVGIFVMAWGSHYSAITVVTEGNNTLIRFNKDLSFINKIKLKVVLQEIPAGAGLLIDGGQARFIDGDALEMLNEYMITAKRRGIDVEIKNIEGKNYPSAWKKIARSGRFDRRGKDS